ncbi:MAG: hypothetical protein FJ312_02885 [SAR202 cluster bacterium]|nr:hypothetical protein [SAR202 cluster bacterium]
MKAAVYQGKQRFQVKDLPDPKPGPGQVQIDIKYSAVCGTDVHGFMYDKVPPGSVIGHEFSGVVAQVGKGVTRWKAGDRVVGYGGTPPPGKGPFWSSDPRYDFSATGFARGRTGAYAGKMVMEEWEPTPIPKNVPDLAAALCEPTAVGVHAVASPSCAWATPSPSSAQALSGSCACRLPGSPAPERSSSPSRRRPARRLPPPSAPTWSSTHSGKMPSGAW